MTSKKESIERLEEQVSTLTEHVRGLIKEVYFLKHPPKFEVGMVVKIENSREELKNHKFMITEVKKETFTSSLAVPSFGVEYTLLDLQSKHTLSWFKDKELILIKSKCK
jgi:hypothetical protein